MVETNKESQSLHDGVAGVKKRKWYSLHDKVYALTNLEEAFKEVKRNRGSAGVDGISIKQYGEKLEDNLRVLEQVLHEKMYTSKPVKRVYIPKADGTQRPLGIPTVEDRLVQAAVKRIIEPIFEAKFLPCSYGFRPNRSAHMALSQIRRDLMEGYTFVIDADLKSYFDTIPHEKLMAKVNEEIADSSVLRLVESFLKAGVMDGGSFQINEKGSPQGGVISPLLSNIYLHGFDAIMMERGHRIVRYADDFVICCRSSKGAERVMATMKRILEAELGLIIHPEKTRIVDNRKESFVFLGYEFKSGYYMTPSDKSMKKFKERVKEITKRNQTVNVEQLIKKTLNPYLRGWGNYFGYGHVKTLFGALDSWIRRRLRAVQLRSWRKVNSLHRMLRKKGWRKEKLLGLRMTAWRSSICQMVHGALTVEHFEQIGLCSLLKLYNELHPQRG